MRDWHKIKGNKNRSIGLNFLYDRKNRLIRGILNFLKMAIFGADDFGPPKTKFN